MELRIVQLGPRPSPLNNNKTCLGSIGIVINDIGNFGIGNIKIINIGVINIGIGKIMG
jgi:hypothetical protein